MNMFNVKEVLKMLIMEAIRIYVIISSKICTKSVLTIKNHVIDLFIHVLSVLGPFYC